MNLGPLFKKLEAVEALTESERAAVRQLCKDVRALGKRRDIISVGVDPEVVHVILHGWAARYSILRDGARQITAFLIPGDFCDVHVTTLTAMDHGIVAITDCEVALAPKKLIDEITRATRVLTRAFWRSTLIDEAILRQWLVSAGRRNAIESVAHLLCELHLRLRLVGLNHDGNLRVPLTQEDIADALGITPMHVNRTIQKLRRQGFLGHGSDLCILDVPGLRRTAGFDPAYLHLGKADSDP